ncbi:MAG: phage portal protein [Gordonibacter sp.]
MPNSKARADTRPICPLSTKQLEDIIARDASSARKAQAKLGERYYDGDNDIMSRRIFYFDADGVLVEDKYVSNIKIPHAFFAELVDQKVDYLINPWERHVVSEDATLDAFLAPYFDHRFNANLAEACRDASKGGFGYLYAYTSEEGPSRFDCAEYRGVVEARYSSVTADCDFMIYKYLDRVNYGLEKVERAQVWDDTWTWFFVKVDGGYEVDASMSDNPRPHRQWTDARGGEWYSGFGAIPFWRIDNNKRQVSDLAPIKAIIDDYDLMKCGLSNNLEDLTEGFVVVKNYSGADGTLDEMIINLKEKKHVGVGDDGDVDIRTVNIPYEARKTNMDIDRENIYHFGMGLNTAGLADTSATTNMAIKAAYALLDLKCNKFEMQIRATLEQMIAFVVDEINQLKDTVYSAEDVKIEFNREVMTNAQDNAQTALIDAQKQQTEVATLLNTAAVYGDDVVLEAVCALLDLNPDDIREIVPEPAAGGLGAASVVLGSAIPTEGEAAAAAEDVTGKTLNGAQTNALIGVIQQYASGTLTYEQAASVIKMSIGCSLEEAKELLGEVG